MYAFAELKKKVSKTACRIIPVYMIVCVSLYACGRQGAPQAPAAGSLPDVPTTGKGLAEVVAEVTEKKEQFVEHRPTVYTAEWPGCLRYGIDSLLRDGMFCSTQVGLCVYDLTADSMLFTFNHQYRLRPASTEKVITAVTALDVLGASHLFQTCLYVTGSVNGSVLCGDVYAVGGFDPCFDEEDMKALVSSLKKEGVDSIAGCFYADVSMKDTLKWGWGWCWDDDNYTLTPLLYRKKDRFREAWFEQLAAQGIATDADKYGRGICPADARPVAVRTHSFDQVLMRMMKESDNLYAEAMFYQLAARSGRRYASRRQAVEQIDALTKKLGLRPVQYQIADGSGLSLYNYLSPELEVAFLCHAYHNKSIYNHLYPSLPIAGHDGTLKRRMTSGPACMNVHAKTGTVEGVSALAGYATASNGHLLAFSIMNQGVPKARTGRDFQDKVCTLLCR